MVLISAGKASPCSQPTYEELKQVGSKVKVKAGAKFPAYL